MLRPPMPAQEPQKTSSSPSAGKPSVCVIGAGCSGLTAVKAMSAAGLAVRCFERSDRVGGNWVYGNNNGLNKIYRSLHINTSRARMQFRDFPMPASYPDYPRHDLIAAYFESYADAFGLKQHIEFQTTVERAEQLGDGRWRINLDSGASHEFDALVVANGHHWDPRWPEPRFPGQFAGIEMHSHDYLGPEQPHDLRGRRVLVVGIGNSAVDIASELGHPGVAERVFLTSRRGAWILPKYWFGKPIDQVGFLPRALPRRMRQAIAQAIYTKVVGKLSDYGLPEPDHALGGAHPTVSADFLTRVGSGDIHIKKNIAELRGERVAFEDGSEEAVDVIIYATGYKVTFPFFDLAFVAAPDNQRSLFLRIFDLERKNLFFIGLAQPLGAIMPLAEVQSELVASHLLGHYQLPSRALMLERTRRAEDEMRALFVRSARHTMQVDFDDYLAELTQEAARAREVTAPNRRASPT